MADAVSTADAAGPVVNEQAWRAPAEGLRGLVDSYVGFRQVGVGPGRHRGLPSPSLTLIFTLNEPLVLAAHPDPAQAPGSYDTLIGGLHTTPAIITHDGRQSGIQLGLSPLGTRALLGMPAGELAGIDLPGDDVLGPLARELQDRLACARDWTERFDILDSALLARCAATSRRPGVRDEVGYAWRRLVRARGSASVRELADETGFSERHLRAMFQSEMGLGLKTAARVIRFDRARRALQQRAASGAPLTLAELAARHGYFDQAHMDREFGLIAGCAPTRWLAEEFRNFQATAA
jgi:AraC-like DNA-binding protein